MPFSHLIFIYCWRTIDKVFKGKKKRLPGEVLTTTSWLAQSVSRGHSTCGKRGANRNCTGLTSKEGLNVKRFSMAKRIAR